MAAGKSYYDIVQAELGEWFLQYFPEHTEAMGGQAGIIANQMAALGGDAYVYNPVLSKLQAEMYDSRVKFPVTIEGALNWVPIRDGVNSDWTKINYIFEYPKDTSYVFGDRVVTTVRANRIILGTRNPLAAMGFSEEMEAFLPEVGAAVDCGFMAGYHHGRIEGRAETLEEFIQLSLRQLTALRSGNRNLRLHCEYLPMSNPEQESVLLKALIPRFHSFGINEAEIMRALCLGFAEEAGRSLGMSGVPAFINLRLFREFGLPRLHLHNLGYYIVLIRSLSCQPESVSLLVCAVNGVKAKQGAVPWEAVGRSLVPLSEVRI